MVQSSAKWVAVVAMALTIMTAREKVEATPTLLFDDPERPTESTLLLATTGTVLRYELIVSDTLIAPRLTIKDDLAGSDTTFSLSFATQINGQPLSCSDNSEATPGSSPASIIARSLASVVEHYHLCSSLPPSIIIGETRVVLIYWQHVNHDPPNFLYDLNQNPVSDAIWVAR